MLPVLLIVTQAMAFCPIPNTAACSSFVRPMKCSPPAFAMVGGTLGETSDPSPLQRVQHLVGNHKLLMFMNGSQASPKCAQSDDAAKCLERLCGAGSIRKNGTYRDENLFVIVDVTADREIRRGLQDYNPGWDAEAPQLFVNGVFMGGSDRMYKMFYSGEFKKMIDTMEQQ